MKTLGDGGSIDHVAFTQTTDDMRVHSPQSHSPLHYTA